MSQWYFASLSIDKGNLRINNTFTPLYYNIKLLLVKDAVSISLN